jgi:hypothetical protein
MHTGVFTTDAGRRRTLLIYGVIWIVLAVGIGLIAGSVAIVAPNLRLFSLALFVGFVLIIYPGVVGTSFLLAKTTARAANGPGRKAGGGAASLYLKACGWVSANTLGGLGSEHRAFLLSGYVCQGCGATLVGGADVDCFAADGRQIALGRANADGYEFGCHKCGYRWPLRDRPPSQPAGI